jgi:hypothetical protein
VGCVASLEVLIREAAYFEYYQRVAPAWPGMTRDETTQARIEDIALISGLDPEDLRQMIAVLERERLERERLERERRGKDGGSGGG